MLKRLFVATTLTLVPAAALAADPAPASEPGTIKVAQANTSSSTVQLVWQVYLGGINLGNIGITSGSTYRSISSQLRQENAQ